MALKSVVPEGWRSAVIVLLYKRKGKRTECKNYKGLNLLSKGGKIYAGILVDKVHRMTEGFIALFQSLSFGLANDPAAFQRATNVVMSGFMFLE